MKRIKMLLTVIAVTTLLSGCSFGTIEEQKTGDVTYEIVKKEEIPEQLKEEIKEAGKKEMWISYADTGKEETYLYVVRGYGTQQTTGYSIEVNACYETVDTVVIRTTLQGPEKKAEYMKMQKEVSEIVKNIRSLQPILANFAEKKSKGVRFTPDQINYLRNTAASMETLNKSLEEKNRRMQELQLEFNPQERAMVQVRGEVYPGTTIIIGDSSMQVKSTYHYCRFERIDGDVKSTPL